MSMKLRLLATLGLAMIGMVALVRATEPVTPVQQSGPESIAQLRDDLILKQRYERGTDEEKKNAKRLGAIIEKIQEFNLKTELDQLGDDLRKAKLTNVTEVKELNERSVRATEKL